MFKIGDTVRIKEGLCLGTWATAVKGNVYTILYIDAEGTVGLNDPNRYIYAPQWLEYVQRVSPKGNKYV